MRKVRQDRRYPFACGVTIGGRTTVLCPLPVSRLSARTPFARATQAASSACTLWAHATGILRVSTWHSTKSRMQIRLQHGLSWAMHLGHCLLLHPTGQGASQEPVLPQTKPCCCLSDGACACVMCASRLLAVLLLGNRITILSAFQQTLHRQRCLRRGANSLVREHSLLGALRHFLHTTF